jgi:hypothetical protein
MARGLQQGIGSLKVLFVFVGLWLASMVVLVIIYTGVEDLRSENARLTEDNRRLISTAERSSVPLVQQASAGGDTVVGLLERARSETAALATGDPTHDTATVRAKLEEFRQRVQSDRIVPDPDAFAGLSYQEALTTLYEVFSAEQGRRVALEERVATLQTELDQAVEGSAQQQSDFEQRTRELSQQLADAEADRERYRRERDEQVANMEREFDTRRQQSDADLTQERRRSAELEEQLGQAQNRFTELQEKLGSLMAGPQTLSTAREPDGTVITAIPGDEVVYVNLGRNDRLVLGLRFAVYSADNGIPADGRAKAQVEVVSIDEKSAECKIVDVSPNEVIVRGDLIANPIYDRNRPVGFVVVGDFDLDRDGRPDLNGAAAIESIIRDWGGTIATELSGLTDFVVVGAAPSAPRAATTTDRSGAGAQVDARQQQAYDRYVDIVDAARALSVPMLTQEVFLNFLGYSGRYAQR